MPELVILGSAQDGGIPHAGCLCESCRNARGDHRKRRLPASIGIRNGDAWTMVDATQAFEEQMHVIWSRRPSSESHVTERYPAPESLILTHAHTGHYVGMWQLDRSVLASPGTQVLAPPRTSAYLQDNEPWAAMLREGFISTTALAWDENFPVVDEVATTPVEVPHRSEWPTDTAALIFEGPKSRILYMPDIDFWNEWDRDIVEEVSRVDIAILDGSFWERPTSQDVPHPPIQETMDRLQSTIDAGSCQIIFTHLNHSNPVALEGSAERHEVVQRGFEIADDGMVFEL